MWTYAQARVPIDLMRSGPRHGPEPATASRRAGRESWEQWLRSSNPIGGQSHAPTQLFTHQCTLGQMHYAAFATSGRAV